MTSRNRRDRRITRCPDCGTWRYLDRCTTCDTQAAPDPDPPQTSQEAS